MPADVSDRRPHGRDEVVAALIKAAARLFAERGPAGVSLRDVATEADVNIGLIHRHIGGKDDLLAAVLRARPDVPLAGASQAGASQAGGLDALLDRLLVGADAGAYTLLAARVILDGYDLVGLQGTFPVVAFIKAQLEE